MLEEIYARFAYLIIVFVSCKRVNITDPGRSEIALVYFANLEDIPHAIMGRSDSITRDDSGYYGTRCRILN